MKLKNIFLIAFISLTGSKFLFSQTRIGDFQIPATFSFKELNTITVNKFKAKTTKFILPDFYSKKEYEDLLNEVWDVTPYEVIFLKDFNESEVKIGDAFAYFTSEFFHMYDDEIYYCYLDFIIVDEIKSNPRPYQSRWDVSRLGSIYFNFFNEKPDHITPPGPRLSPKHTNAPELFSIKEKNYFPVVKKREHLINYKLSYLKNYFQQVNKSIKNQESLDLYKRYLSPELKNLKNEVLYIDKTFQSILPIENYPYKIEFIDSEKLEQMILNKDSSDFYYFYYNLLNNTNPQIFQITNGKTGNIIYREKNYYLGWKGFAIREKEIEDIILAIEKGK